MPRADEIDAAIAAWTKKHSIAEALIALSAASVPAGKIYSVADMTTDPQFLARQMFESHLLADGSSMKIPAIVPKLSATPGATRWLGPELGEHTDTVLASLGFDAVSIASLRADGAL